MSNDDLIRRGDLLAALKLDVGKPSGANLRTKSKPTNEHALALLAVRYPNLSKELAK
ncbi:MAG: hypothetical protein K9K35_10025 [Rhodoferax sp.]|nr:hypothetical protein [Rhodoferax sp.]